MIFPTTPSIREWTWSCVCVCVIWLSSPMGSLWNHDKNLLERHQYSRQVPMYGEWAGRVLWSITQCACVAIRHNHCGVSILSRCLMCRRKLQTEIDQRFTPRNGNEEYFYPDLLSELNSTLPRMPLSVSRGHVTCLWQNVRTGGEAPLGFCWCSELCRV